MIEFAYCGKVTIPGEHLKHVCAAAHALGVHGLVDFLPVSAMILDVVSCQFLFTSFGGLL